MRSTLASLFVVIALPLAAQTPLIDQGRALMEKRDYDKAAEVLEKAVAATPKSAEAHYLLASVYGQQAMTANLFSQMSLASKTKDQFEQAVQLDPNHLDARMGLLQFYMMAPGIAGGSESKAMEQANEIKKRDSFRGHRAWAVIYGRQKKPDLARKEYIDAVREQPGSPKTHIALGTFYLGEKNNAAAATEFESALKADPNYMPAWFWIGRGTVATESNYARGEEALKKYLAYQPKRDEPGLFRAHYWLGQIYEKTGRKAEAKASYTTSLKLNPDQKDVTEALKRVS
ncbi:MAG TPA: tetratricopeptide repeat protein [Thermoanaerobaculia bacterium]|jgi:tetratricopeptide (TPR) repeat protein